MRDWLHAARSAAGIAEIAETPVFTELAQFPQFAQLGNDWHERAAIIEIDGGIPRPLAEALAVLAICPAGIEPSRWQHAIDELARLVDGG